MVSVGYFPPKIKVEFATAWLEGQG